MMKAFVVLNPVAGRHDPELTKPVWPGRKLKASGNTSFMRQLGKKTSKRWFAKPVGIIQSMWLSRAVGMGVPLGILPLGTVNAFATEFGIPDSVEDAFEVLLGDHQVKTIDAILSEDRYYLLHWSFGLISASIADVDRSEKNKYGWIAFLAAGIRKLSGIEPVWVTFDIDGQKHKFKVIEVILVNSDQVDVIDEHLGVDIEIDDGVLDLYTIRLKTRWDFLITQKLNLSDRLTCPSK